MEPEQKLFAPFKRQISPSLVRVARLSKGQLNQVFMNILTNAIDALPKSAANPTIRLRTELVGDRVVIAIADNEWYWYRSRVTEAVRSIFYD
jgi:signal transduction histidine kinase